MGASSVVPDVANAVAEPGFLLPKFLKFEVAFILIRYAQQTQLDIEFDVRHSWWRWRQWIVPTFLYEISHLITPNELYVKIMNNVGKARWLDSAMEKICCRRRG